MSNPEEIELKNRLIFLATNCNENEHLENFLELSRETYKREILPSKEFNVIQKIFYDSLLKHNINLNDFIKNKHLKTCEGCNVCKNIEF
jgi:hypothetical protein